MGRRLPSNGGTVKPGERGSRRSLLAMFFYLGLGVKRWLLIAGLGIGVWSVGASFVIKNLFDLSVPNVLPWFLEGVLIGLGGLFLLLVSAYGLYRSVGPLLLASTSIDSVAETIYSRRSKGRGPRIVTIGGGTGLSVLLRGLKTYTDNLTAILTVADDGGSSGRLRRELGVLPPGDFRNCLVALSDDESLVSELFQYRFNQGDGLEGHSFGNLFIVAMTNVTGSLEHALYESSKVLAVHGRILPATVANLSLAARLTDGTVVHGESSISAQGGSISRILIEPPDAAAHPEAVDAIERAQLIVMGPGSLYTSILPNLLVPGIADAVRNSSAHKVYVCNVATQGGETDGYSVADHVEALQAHTFPSVTESVVYNDGPVQTVSGQPARPVLHDGRSVENVRLLSDNLVDPNHPVRHDSAKLAQLLMDVYHGKRTASVAVGTNGRT